MHATQIEALIRSAPATSGWSPWANDYFRAWRWMIPVLARVASRGTHPLDTDAFRVATLVQSTFTGETDQDLAFRVAKRAARVLIDAGEVRVDRTGRVRGAVSFRAVPVRGQKPADLVSALAHERRHR